MAKEESFGYVYVLSNPVMPNLVKIGMTERENLDKRLKELYSTGVPVPFECEYACRVNKEDCAKIEKALHTAFSPYRVNANREFFRIEVGQAKAILELFDKGDVTDEVSAEISNDLTDEDMAATTKIKGHLPPLDFYQMGMNKGDLLVWKEDQSITVEIVNNKKVQYQGEIVSLSPLSAKLKEYNVKYIAPGNYWLYKGRLLNEIYKETYLMED